MSNQLKYIIVKHKQTGGIKEYSKLKYIINYDNDQNHLITIIFHHLI